MDSDIPDKLEPRYDASIPSDGYPPKDSGGKTYKGEILWDGADPVRVKPIKKGPAHPFDW